jgi:hypothetical protein
MTTKCEACNGELGNKGPKDGWQLPDGSTVCDDCVKRFLNGFADKLSEENEKQKTDA